MSARAVTALRADWGVVISLPNCSPQGILLIDGNWRFVFSTCQNGFPLESLILLMGNSSFVDYAMCLYLWWFCVSRIPLFLCTRLWKGTYGQCLQAAPSRQGNTSPAPWHLTSCQFPTQDSVGRYEFLLLPSAVVWSSLSHSTSVCGGSSLNSNRFLFHKNINIVVELPWSWNDFLKMGQNGFKCRELSLYRMITMMKGSRTIAKLRRSEGVMLRTFGNLLMLEAATQRWRSRGIIASCDKS